MSVEAALLVACGVIFGMGVVMFLVGCELERLERRIARLESR